MSCRKEIEMYFDSLADGDIVIAVQAYRENFSQYSEMAFFKVLERMVKSGFLIRISKGVYSRNPVFGEIAVTEEIISKDICADKIVCTGNIDSTENIDSTGNIDGTQNIEKTEYMDDVQNVYTDNRDGILNYFFGNNNDNGMFVGCRLYEKYGISNEDNGLVELYSNLLTQATKSIGNIKIKRVNVDLKFDNARLIELFEILQNYFSIKGLNQEKVNLYAKQAALNYNDDAAQIILNQMKYKKSTIAAVKNVLEMYEIENSLGIHLSGVSKYKIPIIKKL